MQTLNFGLIGVGRFGKHYIRLLQEMKGVKLVAVAAKTKKSLLYPHSKTLSSTLGIPLITILKLFGTSFKSKTNSPEL